MSPVGRHITSSLEKMIQAVQQQKQHKQQALLEAYFYKPNDGRENINNRNCEFDTSRERSNSTRDCNRGGNTYRIWRTDRDAWEDCL